MNDKEIKWGPSFQLYAQDFLIDTIGWSDEEVGFYLRLLLVEWVNGPLPKNEKNLRKIWKKTPKKFEKLWSTLSSKFIENPKDSDEIINPRLEKTREDQIEYRLRQSEAGKASARSRKKEKKATTVQPSLDSGYNRTPNQNPTLQSSPSSSPSSLLESSKSPLELDQKADLILEDYNLTFLGCDGLEVNPEDFNFKERVKRLMAENKYTVDDFKSVHSQAKKDLLHFKAHLCKWKSIYKYHNFGELLENSTIPTPKKTINSDSQNSNEAKHIENHKNRVKKEAEENQRYQLSSVDEKLSIILKLLVTEHSPYMTIRRDEIHRSEVEKRIFEFIKNNITERATVMVQVNSIVNDYMDEIT